MAKRQQSNRVIFENELELITFTLDGHLLHTHKSTFVQRHSLDTWPDFESAKKAFEADLGHVRWGEPEQWPGASDFDLPA